MRAREKITARSVTMPAASVLAITRELEFFDGIRKYTGDYVFDS
jgi:hypothetical protein